MSFGTKSTGDAANPDWANLIEDALGDGNPAQALSFVVFKDGSDFKARNGTDGTIDYSGTVGGTVIQACLDACESAGAGTTFLRWVSGGYDVPAGLTITENDVNLIGENLNTELKIASGQEAITVGSSAKIYRNVIKNLYIENQGTFADATSGLILDIPTLFYMDYVSIKNFEIGIEVDTTANYGVYNRFQSINIQGCSKAYSVDGANGFNEIIWVGGDFHCRAGTPAGSIGHEIQTGDTERFYGGSWEGFETAISTDKNGHQWYGSRFEANTTGFDFLAGSSRNLVIGGTITGHTTAVADAGSGNRVSDLYGYITRNSGTGTITNPATTAVITHNLDITPSLEDITIIGGENPTNAITAIWVDTIGANTFTVNIEPAPGASNWDFGWRVNHIVARS
jgi:hypothetical protein